jgi:hypothetical protein
MERKTFITIVMNKTNTGLLINDDSKTGLPVPQHSKVFSSEENAKSDYLKVIKKNFILIPKII